MGITRRPLPHDLTFEGRPGMEPSQTTSPPQRQDVGLAASPRVFGWDRNSPSSPEERVNITFRWARDLSRNKATEWSQHVIPLTPQKDRPTCRQRLLADYAAVSVCCQRRSAGWFLLTFGAACDRRGRVLCDLPWSQLLGTLGLATNGPHGFVTGQFWVNGTQTGESSVEGIMWGGFRFVVLLKTP